MATVSIREVTSWTLALLPARPLNGRSQGCQAVRTTPRHDETSPPGWRTGVRSTARPRSSAGWASRSRCSRSASSPRCRRSSPRPQGRGVGTGRHHRLRGLRATRRREVLVQSSSADSDRPGVPCGRGRGGRQRFAAGRGGDCRVAVRREQSGLVSEDGGPRWCGSSSPVLPRTPADKSDAVVTKVSRGAGGASGLLRRVVR